MAADQTRSDDFPVIFLAKAIFDPLRFAERAVDHAPIADYLKNQPPQIRRPPGHSVARASPCC
ncbi:hypothetical protein EOS_38075 [Caballeronia mineralivorans PML1(12)]|uniref:Uncharacterized protein n=1 Tax=Caballeronia mineralivorans PML1(12) TaxID=908627 RepID=A0A0J1CK54_9BURK|nr:hypothetical protein EOS_38075 [Caballeronia mineralivorans PML1(12)]